MSEESVYLVLGSRGSGRRELVLDLIDGGLTDDEKAIVAVPQGEPSIPADESLQAHAKAELVRYESLSELQPVDDTLLFVLYDGLATPADAIEAFQPWLKRMHAGLARIIGVVDCRLGAEEPELAPWFDCMVHFSDALLLNRREGLSPKWPQDFIKGYEDKHYPCMFEYVKKGRVQNPARVLDPVARRMTLLFDDIDAVDQLDIDPDNLPDEPIDLVAPEDPWLERHPSGQRVKPVPSVEPFLADQ